MRSVIVLCILSPLLLANTAGAAKREVPLSEPLQKMLDAALASNNEGEVATVSKYLRVAAPESADLIRSVADNWNADRAARRNRELQESDFFALVTGRAELGGYASTGNTDNIGLTGIVDLAREGYRWRHKLRLQADYQENAGVTSREHYLAEFQPNYKVDDRLYIYGSTQYESDKFFGYYDRFSASAGAGYSAIKRRGLTLDLELGPAYRHTDFTDQTIESNLAARGSVDLDWQISPALTFRQDAAAYVVTEANSTVSSTTALNAKLFGPLSAQLSYAVQYESMPPAGRVNADTTSRAALVYSF